jgi:hypothetical protein
MQTANASNTLPNFNRCCRVPCQQSACRAQCISIRAALDGVAGSDVIGIIQLVNAVMSHVGVTFRQQCGFQLLLATPPRVDPSVIRFTAAAGGPMPGFHSHQAWRTSMFLSHQMREAVSQRDQRELTQAELSEVTGGVVCSRDPAMQTVMWVATGFLPGTANGPFLCW